MIVAESKKLFKEFNESVQDRDFKKADILRLRLDPSILKSKPFLITEAKYHLYRKDVNGARVSVAEAVGNFNNADPVEDFWRNYLKGCLEIIKRNFQIAQDLFNQAEEFLSYVKDPLEEGEFHYHRGSAYYELKKIALSIRSAEKAHSIFKTENKTIQIANCNILLGNNYQKINEYEEAEKCYKKGIYIESLRPIVFHNLGFICSQQKKSEEAIGYLKKAINSFEDFKKGNPEFRIKNYFLLAREYYRLNQVREAAKWYEKGTNLCIEESDQEYFYHFRVLKANHDPDYESLKDLEKEYKKMLDYFRKQNLWDYVREYSEQLAAYFKDGDQFEQACAYYNEMTKAQQKINGEV